MIWVTEENKRFGQFFWCLLMQLLFLSLPLETKQKQSKLYSFQGPTIALIRESTLMLGVNTPWGQIHTKGKREWKWKILKNKKKRSKNKRQASKKIFAFASTLLSVNGA